MVGSATLTIVVSSSSIVEARNRLSRAMVRARPTGRASRATPPSGGAVCGARCAVASSSRGGSRMALVMSISLSRLVVLSPPTLGRFPDTF